MTGATHHLPPSSPWRVATADLPISPGGALALPEGAVGGGEAITAGASIGLLKCNLRGDDNDNRRRRQEGPACGGSGEVGVGHNVRTAVIVPAGQ